MSTNGQKPLALFSAFYKDGLVDFAKGLLELGFGIHSSGGTADVLSKAGIPVTDVATIVGKPLLGKRVITLSRDIHAGLLARFIDTDIEEMEENGLRYYHLVDVNFYDMEKMIATPGATEEQVTELTDIGGPTLLRSAAKGRRIVICDANDRNVILEWIRAGKPNEAGILRDLAAKAELAVARYTLASATYLSHGGYRGMTGELVHECLYGENGHQMPAGLYRSVHADPLALDQFKLIAGTALSYNNYCDLDRGLQTMTHIAAVFETNGRSVSHIALGEKHGNACGAAVGKVQHDDQLFFGSQVASKMVAGDPGALFGGVVLVNFPIDEPTAIVLTSHTTTDGAVNRRPLDVVVAPEFSPAAIELLKRKNDKCRLLVNPALSQLSRKNLDNELRFRYVRGGFLVQPNYRYIFSLDDAELEFTQTATAEEIDDMLLAWAICATSTSNTITLVRDRQLVGNGVGQQHRAGAARLALTNAQRVGHETAGAVAASDSFFPFTDGVEVLHEAGVKAILATRGSINDQKVVGFCAERNMPFYTVPDKVGRGFYGH